MLRSIIKGLLVEGRLDDVKAKFPELAETGVIDMLSRNDPSGNNKYLMWMAREVWEGMYPDTSNIWGFGIKNERVPARVLQYVKDFHKNHQRLKQRDIMAYDEAEDVRDAVAALGSSKTQQKKETKLEGADKLYEDENFLLLFPKNKDAVCLYGAETQWCITARGARHYENYIADGKIFYFLINKTGKGDENSSKIAFVYDIDYNGASWEEAYDAQDNQVGDEEVQFLLSTVFNDLGVPDTTPWRTNERSDEMAEDFLSRMFKLMDNDAEIRVEESETVKRQEEERQVQENLDELNAAVEEFNRTNDILYAYADEEPYQWDGENAYYRIDISGRFSLPDSFFELLDKEDLATIIDDVLDIRLSQYNVDINPRIGGIEAVFHIEDSDLFGSDHDSVMGNLDYYDKSNAKEQELVNAAEALLVNRGDLDIGLEKVEGKFSNFTTSFYEASDSEEENSVEMEMVLVQDPSFVRKVGRQYRESSTTLTSTFIQAVTNVVHKSKKQLALPGIEREEIPFYRDKDVQWVLRRSDMHLAFAGSGERRPGTDHVYLDTISVSIYGRNDEPTWAMKLASVKFLNGYAHDIRMEFQRILRDSL